MMATMRLFNCFPHSNGTHPEMHRRHICYPVFFGGKGFYLFIYFSRLYNNEAFSRMWINCSSYYQFTFNLLHLFPVSNSCLFVQILFSGWKLETNPGEKKNVLNIRFGVFLLTLPRHIVGSPCGVAVYVLKCDIVMSEIEFLPRYYVHFPTNTLEKCWDFRFLPLALG